MLKSWTIFILILSSILSGCATTYNPATNQQEFILITTPMEVSIGNTLAANISRDFKISKDDQKIKRVTKIGKEIAGFSDRKDLKYHFTVIEDKALNAFTSPGGYVYLNSGLIEKATDDELACVIGHEVGHVAARHIAKKLQAQIGYDILMNIAVRKAGLYELRTAASVSYNLIMLGYSREDELLADRLGVKYAHRAGYDPYAMISFLKKLKSSKDEDIGVVFMRSHPYTSQRIKMLEKKIPVIIEGIDKKPAAEIQPEKQKYLHRDISQIAANKTRPSRVMCPVCRRIFSGNTNYCLYDGAKLQ